jgi:hypothetical protein
MTSIKSRKTIGSIIFFFSLFFSFSVFGQNNILTINSFEEIDREPHDEVYRIVKFSVLPNEQEKNELSRQGIQLLDYVGHSSYLALIKKGINLRSNLPGLEKISKIGFKNKCSQQIFQGETCSMSNGSKAILLIQHMPMIPRDKVLALVSSFGMNNLKYAEDYRLLYVECEIAKIQDLINQYWIQYVSCAPEPGEPEDREGKTLHRVNQITSNTKENIFLDGSGVKVCVRDDGFVGPHVDFKGRINNQVYGSNGTHGDMVSGIICGAGNIDPVISGMATAAELFVINYQDDFLDATLDLHQQNGVVITNSSYSNGCNLGYTAITQIVDKQIYENPSLLHVFSAGNSNNLNCGYGAGNQWGNITGGHKIGKNVITAANVQINGLIDPSSSRGPTKDGRLKPDVASRGNGQLSTQDGNIYQVGGGTSAAAPGIAGTAVLLYQAYKNFNGGINPPSALIKSVLMNTASDIGTPGPDYIFGFGVIDAYSAYKCLEKKNYQNLEINQSELKEIIVDIPEGIAQANFMIYWAEKEASLIAERVLINDMDMEVINPSGTTILPWVLDPTPDPAILAAGARPGIDSLNNVEQVTIPFPAPGKYIIRIKGKFLPDNKVPFILLSHYDEKVLRLTSPIGGEKYNSLEVTQIHYKSLSSDSVFIRFSPNGGRTWTNVRGVPGTSRLVSWTVPNNIISDSCVIEIKQGSLVETSNFFTISSTLTGLRILKYCPNEVTIGWNASVKDSFQIYTLQGNYMQAHSIVYSNQATIPIDNPKNDWWFSVAGFQKGVLGRRLKAIGLPDTLINCPIKNDLSLKTRNNWLSRDFVSCGNDTYVRPEVIVHNRNSNLAQGFSIQYFDGINKVTETYNTPLKYKDSVIIELKQGLRLDFEGVQSIPVWVSLNTDENVFNDTSFIKIENQKVADEQGVYPMLEGFEGSAVPANWKLTNPIPVSNWIQQNQIDKNGQLSKMLGFTSSAYSYSSYPIDLYSTTIDLSKSVEPFLYFDYAYHKDTRFTSYPDSFYVDVITVCEGVNKTRRIFMNGSTDLYTVDTSSDLRWVPLTGTNWKNKAFDLSEFKGKKIVIQLGLLRGVNGHFFLDNVHVKERLSETPSLQLTIDPDEICITKTVKFSTSALVGSGISYKWDFGNLSLPRTATGVGPHNVRFSSSGQRNISLRVQGTDFDVVKTSSVYVYNQPGPSFDFNIGPNRTVSFEDKSSHSKDLLWDFGDGQTSTEINPVHQYDSGKIYNVKLTVSNICGTNANSREVDLLNTSTENIIEDQFLLFPNPVTHLLHVKSNLAFTAWRIIDLHGKIQSESVLRLAEKSIDIQTDALASGVYLIELNFASGKGRKKFVKM